MYHDLLSLKQSPFMGTAYSNSSKRLGVALSGNIIIYNFKNGLIKTEAVKISPKEFSKKDYHFGEPEQMTFPILRPYPNNVEEAEWSDICFSDIFLPSIGGGFQLLMATTSNSHIVLLKSPDISSTLTNYTWDYVISLSDIVYNLLKDPIYNPPIKENKTEFIDRNLHPRPFMAESESISNLEYKKRYEWLSPRSLGFSNIMKVFKDSSLNQSQYYQHYDNNGVEIMSFITIGTKRGLVLFQYLITNLDCPFDESNVKFFKLIEMNDWVISLAWKPTFSIENFQDNDFYLEDGIVVLGLGDGSVTLYRIGNNGEIKSSHTIIEPDNNPVSILQWSPINNDGTSYLIICKGLGFYLYNFELNKLSNYFIVHRDSITSVSFSDELNFSTSSIDNNIIEFKIESSIWSDDKNQIIKPVNVNYMKKDDKCLGIKSLLASPNKLISIYSEEIPKATKMFEKIIRSRFNISCKKEIIDFNLFKSSFIQKFKNEESKNIWDYFLYINIYSNEQVLDFLNELIKDQSVENKILHYKLIIKLYSILKKKLKDYDFKEINKIVLEYKFNIKENYVFNFLKAFSIFISEEKEYQFLDYQITSITLMLYFIKSLSITNKDREKEYLKIYNDTLSLIGGQLKSTETCHYCLKEIPIGITSSIENIVECPECHCQIERCSRTFLLICTPKTLNCDYCYSRSIVFSNEDPVESPTQILDQAIYETSSIRYQFPWIFSHRSACIYCRTPLNGLLSNDRILNLNFHQS